jgi:hypothetical protein
MQDLLCFDIGAAPVDAAYQWCGILSGFFLTVSEMKFTFENVNQN